MKVYGHGAISAAGLPALVYALGQDIAAVVVGMNSLAELEVNAAAAAAPGRLSQAEHARLLAAARAARTPELQWWRHERQAVAGGT